MLGYQNSCCCKIVCELHEVSRSLLGSSRLEESQAYPMLITWVSDTADTADTGCNTLLCQLIITVEIFWKSSSNCSSIFLQVRGSWRSHEIQYIFAYKSHFLFFKVKFWALNKGCDLYVRYKYNGSQLSIPDIWAKIMGATYMWVQPICEDTH